MIHAVKSLKGGDVTSLIEALMVLDKRLPVRIQTDNGSVFISKSLDKWSINMIWHSTSLAPENRQIIRLLKQLTAAFRINTWTFTGSCHQKMRRKTRQLVEGIQSWEDAFIIKWHDSDRIYPKSPEKPRSSDWVQIHINTSVFDLTVLVKGN